MPQQDADGPGLPWCGNPATKELDHPIGFLAHNDAAACELFEDKRAEAVVPAPAAHVVTGREPATRKEEWSLLVVRLCFCGAFLKCLIEGQYDMTYKLGLALIALSAISVARELSADFAKGSLKLTR
jgi:hypothetical protein